MSEPARQCSVDGCGRPYRARGFCIGHYNERVKPDRHRTERTCERCGRVYVTTRTDGRFCSLECRDEHRTGMTRAERAARPPRKRKPQPYVRKDPQPMTCEWCGSTFRTLAVGRARWCSPRCKSRRGAVRRRALEAGAGGSFTWSEVVAIWLKLGRVCAYCRRPVEAGELEPDHVVALSRGGSNSITNVVPCCKPCNCDKRELSLGEWARDRWRRGLEPCWLHPDVRHLTDATLEQTVREVVGGLRRAA